MVKRPVTRWIALLAAGALSACTSQGPSVARATEAAGEAGPGPLASLAQAPAQSGPIPAQESERVDASRRTAIVQAAA